MTEDAIDRFAELHAPAHWQAVEFISDLHLQAEEPATFHAWLEYLDRPPSERPDALFILGDLFEVWVGDDVLGAVGTDPPDFWQQCAQALLAYARTTPVYFMAGNRDFLLGHAAALACGMQRLNDPCILQFMDRRWLLSHGDALCLADKDYMRFRALVRQQAWQNDFLNRPLQERRAIARDLRSQSEARKRASGNDPSLWADVDTAAAIEWLHRAEAHTLIHGHTHRPARHVLAPRLSREVLSDWDLSATPARAEVLRLDAGGLHRYPVSAAGMA
ncbi:MAG: UDP-2,3-diacylglucosamine diphosphatase [Hydrogenophaga sp.]|nr:UDP-2,3-diacylglucosamine diphosphatase [Hydrogenophaga sp.]